MESNSTLAHHRRFAHQPELTHDTHKNYPRPCIIWQKQHVSMLDHHIWGLEKNSKIGSVVSKKSLCSWHILIWKTSINESTYHQHIKFPLPSTERSAQVQGLTKTPRSKPDVLRLFCWVGPTITDPLCGTESVGGLYRQKSWPQGLFKCKAARHPIGCQHTKAAEKSGPSY